MLNVEKVAGAMVVAVRAYVAWSLDKFAQPLIARVDGVERSIKELPAPAKGDPGDIGPEGPKGDRGEPGAKGADGASVSVADLEPVIELHVAAAVAEIPEPKDGVPGKDGAPGKDVAIEDVLPELRAAVAVEVKAAVDALPPPQSGARGDRGEKGEQGLRGEPGVTVQGASAFEIAKASGFVGSEGEWLLTLRGMDGSNGRDGSAGQNGQDGRDGRDGDRGRDAIEIANIIDGVDMTRSYPRGTAAAAWGGTFWATRATDPVSDGNYEAAGWMCIVRGIADVTEHLEDGGRVLVRNYSFSDGGQKDFRHKTLTLIDRGVYQSGKAYDAGDVITYGGSAFIAQADTKSAPGNGQDWRLAVKRGKDGKDPT